MKIKIGVLKVPDSADTVCDLIDNCIDFDITFCTSDISLIVQHINKQVPEVLLIVTNQNNLNTFREITEVNRHWPGLKIMVVTDQQDLYMARQVIEAGAHGFANQITDISTLLDGCRQICKGEIYFDPVTRKLLLKEIIYGN